jgi:hypothetical protein
MALQLAAKVNSMVEARSAFGEPDDTIEFDCKIDVPSGSHENTPLRQHRFSSMWKSFDLLALERKDGSIRFGIVGKRESKPFEKPE